MSSSSHENPCHPISGRPPIAFDTKRLHLRALRPKDDKLIFDLYASDPVATKYMSFKCTNKLSDTSWFVKNATDFLSGNTSQIKHLVWVIELKESNEPIGTVGIGPLSTFSLSGGYIINPKWWGNGYASEAWGCIVEWAKTQPAVWRIEATHHPENPASGKILEKAGMKFEGRLKNYLVFPNLNDHPQDTMMYAWGRQEV